MPDAPYASEEREICGLWTLPDVGRHAAFVKEEGPPQPLHHRVPRGTGFCLATARLRIADTENSICLLSACFLGHAQPFLHGVGMPIARPTWSGAADWPAGADGGGDAVQQVQSAQGCHQLQ